MVMGLGGGQGWLNNEKRRTPKKYAKKAMEKLGGNWKGKKRRCSQKNFGKQDWQEGGRSREGTVKVKEDKEQL